MTDDLNRDLGRVEGKLDRIIAQNEDSASSRAKLYERLEALDRRTEKVEAAVDVMQPLVSDFAQLKQRGLGILAVIGFLWLFIGGLILQGLQWIFAAVTKGLQ